MRMPTDTNVIERVGSKVYKGMSPTAFTDCPALADGTAQQGHFARAMLLSNYCEITRELGGEPEQLLEEARIC